MTQSAEPGTSSDAGGAEHDLENGTGSGAGGGGPSEEQIPSPTDNLIRGSSLEKRSSGRAIKSVCADKKKKRKKKKVRTPEEAEQDALIKYGSLFLLVAQMVGLVLLMRYSRTRHDEGSKDGQQQGETTGQLYLASTAVFVMEAMKLIICIGVVFVQAGSTLSALSDELRTHILNSPVEVLKLCVPSLLYTVQNNLLYLALTNLDAATYQVCYQLKILTTALFSAILLGRQFSRTKWLSLLLLTVGVAIVQTSGSSDKHAISSPGGEGGNNRIIGLTAVLCAACTSGFSGVYFEKILKGSETSLWLRNIQMGLPSVMIAYLTIYVKDAATVAEKGFFVGYSPIVWTVVTVQAAGGLIVALVVKYADNVLKVFATSFSIIISCVISAFVFDFRPNILFLLGASLVMMSTVMYSRPETVRRKKRPVLPLTGTSGAAGQGIRKSSMVM